MSREALDMSHLAPEQREHRRQRAESARANSVRRPQRNRAIVELRAAGLTHEQIAEQLTRSGQWGKISRKAVMTVLRKEMEKFAEENREDLSKLRALDLHRIDLALQVLWPRVREGNLKAMREWRAFIDQRARLLGTYAAQKHEVHGQVEHILDDTARDEIERLERAFITSQTFDGEAEEVVDAEAVIAERLLEP